MSSAPRGPSGYEHGVHETAGRPTSQRTAGYAENEPYAYREDATGWTGLAGWLLVLGGLWSFFAGLALVVRASYFRSLPGYASVSSTYPYHWNLSGWGWANLIFGIVVAAVGVCVLLSQGWARWAGVVLAVIGAVGTFLFLPFYPFWSILVIAIDVFIIWALTTARRRQDA